jgi:HEAT repeat protein
VGLYGDFTPERALACIRARPATTHVNDWMKTDPPAGEIEAAIAYARESGLRAAVPFLPPYLRDAPYFLANAACRALGWLEAVELLPDLLDLLRPAAAQERGLFPTDYLNYDDTPQDGALEAFEHLAGTEAGRALIPLVAHGDEAVRAAARGAVPELLRLLEDVSLTSASWRRQALRALEVIGAADTIDAVTRCLEDPDRHVREAAAAALRTLPPRA